MERKMKQARRLLPFGCLLALASVFFGSQPVWAGIPGFMLARMGELAGSVELIGEKLPNNGVIMAFFNQETGPPPIESGMRRVPDMLGRSDGSGNFNIRLLPGKYFVGMLIRETGEGPGPPRPGEKFFFAQDDTNHLRLFEVPERQTVSVGVLRGVAPEKVKDFMEFTTISGRVVDEEGKPLAGAFVLVKTNPSTARPLFISSPTDSDGRYRIKVPPDTIYYIVARDQIQGGRPLPGSYVGTYGKTAPTQGTGSEGIGAPAGVGSGGEGDALPVSGGKGQVIDNVDIAVFRLPDPEGNRNKYQKDAAKEGSAKPEPETVAPADSQ